MLYTKRNGLVGSSFNWKGVDVQDLLNKERRFGGIGYVAKTYEEAVKGVKAMAKVISENSNWLSTSKIKLEPVSEDMVSAKMTMVGFFNKEEQKNMAPGGNNPNTVYDLVTSNKKDRKKKMKEYGNVFYEALTKGDKVYLYKYLNIYKKVLYKVEKRKDQLYS